MAENLNSKDENIILKTEDEIEIKYCDCRGTNDCGFEPGPEGILICTACGGYVI